METTGHCFYCAKESDNQCQCGEWTCGLEHALIHRPGKYCLPFKVSRNYSPRYTPPSIFLPLHSPYISTIWASCLCFLLLIFPHPTFSISISISSNSGIFALLSLLPLYHLSALVASWIISLFLLAIVASRSLSPQSFYFLHLSFSLVPIVFKTEPDIFIFFIF